MKLLHTRPPGETAVGEMKCTPQAQQVHEGGIDALYPKDPGIHL